MSRSLSRLQAVLLGIVVLLGLGLLTTGLFAVGSRQWLWSDTFHLRVGFRQIRGVEVGTRVRVQGIEAGEVEAVLPPTSPGGDVLLRLRLDGRLRSLVRADATVQIASEGMIGGKVVEINPGTAAAQPVEDDALLASRPATELTDVLGQVQTTLEGIREGQGTVGKLLKDPEAYTRLLAALQQSQETLKSIQQDADALKRMPIVRSYVEDPHALLVRPNCERNRQTFTESELFEPGRAVLTADGRRRLDELAPWLAGLKHPGSEVVVAAYADPRTADAAVARTVTRQQSEAVCTYLTSHHAIQKMNLFSSRKVIPLGLGTSLPPEPEVEALPPSRVEVLVFVPQG
jgi:phospholipid/cholesterol/gamma-HCH transport system substrate-binding protein